MKGDVLCTADSELEFTIQDLTLNSRVGVVNSESIAQVSHGTEQVDLVLFTGTTA